MESLFDLDPGSPEQLVAIPSSVQDESSADSSVVEKPALHEPADAFEQRVQTRRMRVDLSYLGTGFRGFAAQPGQRTVAGELKTALERRLRHSVDLTCAGRTDAGVHARGQVVSFDAREDADLEGLLRALNKQLNPEIAITSVSWPNPDFDARHSAKGRRYRYSILSSEAPDPFTAQVSWQMATKLDLAAMRLACDALIGEHDFSSFCRRPPVGSMTRRVREAHWADLGEGRLVFEIAASSFCHQMVRSVVGTLVEVGTGKRRAGEMLGIIRAGDRSAAGNMAPARGLCLWQVDY